MPQPQTRKDGTRPFTLHGKPAAIVTRLPGGYEPDPTAEHCRLTGQTLARAHLAAVDFPDSPTESSWHRLWVKHAPIVYPYMDGSTRANGNPHLPNRFRPQARPIGPRLRRALALRPVSRQRTVCLRPANARAWGFIDFYFAGCDHWLFDVAVCVNDWCIDRTSGDLIPPLVDAWLTAYASVRPFTDAERRAPARHAACSRVEILDIPVLRLSLTASCPDTQPHDPTHFERVMAARTQGPIPSLPGSASCKQHPCRLCRFSLGSARLADFSFAAGRIFCLDHVYQHDPDARQCDATHWAHHLRCADAARHIRQSCRLPHSRRRQAPAAGFSG